MTRRNTLLLLTAIALPFVLGSGNAYRAAGPISFRDELDYRSLQSRRLVTELERDRDALLSRIAAAGPAPAEEAAAWHDRLEVLTQRIESAKRWSRRDRRFLQFDPWGTGVLAEVIGDIDRAEHLVVVIPGTGSRPENYEAAVAARARQLRDEVVARGESRGVAIVAWLGYRAPADLAEAADPARAAGGAESLGALIDEIDSRRGRRAHVTVIGHSYGSLVAAKVATLARVDDLVLIGSPGVGSPDVRRLELAGRTRVWVGLATSDPIRFVPDWIHGRSPAHSDFGAFRFATDDSRGHSEYFKEGSIALQNLARIALGHYDRVERHIPAAPSQVAAS